MTPENKQWIQDNTWMLISVFFVFFTILMQILHWLKINVFKVVVLMGTFALALAFAGNDLCELHRRSPRRLLVLHGFHGQRQRQSDGFLMTSLLGPAKTPWYFLIGAGAIMVYALCTSKKAHAVIKTSVDLSRQDEGEETFWKHPDSPYNRPFQHDTCQRHLTHHPGQHQEMAGHPLPKRRSDHRRRRCFSTSSAPP